MKIKNIKLDELKNHPDNARVNDDLSSLADSLDIHGQYKPLIVQKSTHYVLAGNHTLKALKMIGAKTANVVYADVDDKEAKEIMLVDNKTSDNSHYDEKKLHELLTKQNLDVIATGFTYNEVDQLITKFEKTAQDKINAILDEQQEQERTLQDGDVIGQIGLKMELDAEAKEQAKTNLINGIIAYGKANPDRLHRADGKVYIDFSNNN